MSSSVNNEIDLTTAIRVLLDKEAIRECLMRYCRAVDRVSPEDIGAAYHEKSWDYHGVVSMSGPDLAALDWKAGATMQHHHLGQSLIDLDGDVAFAETYFLCHQRSQGGSLSFAKAMSDDASTSAADASGADREVITLMVGRYVDRFEREHGEWRVRIRKVIIDWASEAPGPVDRSLFDAFSNGHQGQRKPDDIVYHLDRLTFPD